MERNELPMSKLVTKEQILEKFHDGMTIAIGGFACTGTPRTLIDFLCESGVKNLTLISNDAGYPDVCEGKLYTRHMVVKSYHSHVGMNPLIGEYSQSGELDLHLTPQGSLMEKIRCGGIGAGGILVKTGIGTDIEKSTEDRELVEIKGEKWLVEQPLRADVALIRARSTDLNGNLTYHGTMRSTNPLVAMCADCTIVEADNIMDDDEIRPDDVVTPAIFVDMIYDNQRRYFDGTDGK